MKVEAGRAAKRLVQRHRREMVRPVQRQEQREKGSREDLELRGRGG